RSEYYRQTADHLLVLRCIQRSPLQADDFHRPSAGPGAAFAVQEPLAQNCPADSRLPLEINMNQHHYGLILAGGRGTRFWPRSRKRSAKQVLNVVGDRSLIQATVDRLSPVIPQERLWVLTNEHLREIIIEQLPGIPKEQVLAEPA